MSPITLSALKPELAIVPNERVFSVTAVSIVRMVYLVKVGWGNPYDVYGEYEDVYIWTNVETNVSIICGQ